MSLETIHWDFPQAFWALLVLPLWLGLEFWRHRSGRFPRLLYSTLGIVRTAEPGLRARLRHLPAALTALGFAAGVLALARPQLENVTVERSADGIDIVMILDTSTSMRAEDLKPNRLEAARAVAMDFVDGRISDRVGLVVFARQSYTACPPTLDYNLLTNVLENVRMGQIQDGTAIGMGLATAVNRLKDSKAISRVVILLTDGMNNAGEIDPVTAAELALTYQIKIYTIGVGSRGTAPYPIDDPIFGRRYQSVSVDIDEEMLTEIASMTGGQYFRATNTDALQEIYDRIDEMERTEVEEIYYTDYQDLYPYAVFAAVALILVGTLTERFWLRSPIFAS